MTDNKLITNSGDEVNEAEEPLLRNSIQDELDLSSSSSSSQRRSQQVPELYCCPITRDLMVHPVLLIESGQVFEKEAILNWIKSGKNTCPVAGSILEEIHLQTIYPLKSAIHQWAQENGVSMSGMEPWTQLWKQRELHHEISYHNLRTQESNCSIFVRACFGWSHLALFVLSLLYLCTVIFYLT
eukprot:TRINITY_DN11747_c0_g1_i8.p2 TRINITY_DN11747_c0_g1~~TRINITY_DN11747_c0_g1_i8.p2  ORF type:complete len:184 (+),score=11.28 TRINITY_DN11747_c0_g1_i8:164-715(+)